MEKIVIYNKEKVQGYTFAKLKSELSETYQMLRTIYPSTVFDIKYCQILEEELKRRMSLPDEIAVNSQGYIEDLSTVLDAVDIEFLEDATFHGTIGMGTLSVIPITVKKGEKWIDIDITKETFIPSSKPNFNGKTTFRKDIKEKKWLEYVGATLPNSNSGSCSIPIDIFKITKRYGKRKKWKISKNSKKK